jgi:Amt family ammonium transporter
MMRSKWNRSVLGSSLATMALSSVAVAQDAVPASPINSGDTAWLLASTALVLFMTPGLAFFYGGMVRGKNAIATILQSMIAIAIITVAWVVCGYSFAFAPSLGGFLGGFDFAFLNNVTTAPNPDYAATIPHSLFMIYQCMFAIITPALISGAFAERMKFKSYLLFIVAWSVLIYAPLAHWVWGVGGFLRTAGTLDFAGGLVVHLSAGISALAAAMAIGKRNDYGKAEMTPNNIPFIALGTGMLWFGWFGFNGGSALGSGELAVTALTNTHLAAASATLTWMLIDWYLKGKPSVMGACIGAVVGLIAVTPASGFVTMQSALLIGIVGSAAANFVAVWRAKTQIDDSLDVFACHGVGGAIGVLMAGFLATKSVNSAGADGSFELFFTQLKGVAIVGVFCFVGTFVIMKAIDMIFGLRPSQIEEVKGLDQSEHNERALAS